MKINQTSLCSGYGQYHTDKNKPLNDVNWQQITQLVDNPPSLPKAKAQWLIPSTTFHRKLVDAEAANGDYWVLWLDIDDTPPSIAQVATIISKTFSDIQHEVYTSKSATSDCQKCRVLIPLEEALTINDWRLAQECLNDLIESYRIKPDRANESPVQLCYLPNKGAYYDKRSNRTGNYLNARKFFGSAMRYKKEEMNIAEKQTKRRIEEAKLKRQTRKSLGLKSPIDEFNDTYPIEDILLQAGYTQRGDRFRHPNSESGSFSASVQNCRVNTLSTSDPLYSNGEGAHDAFSAFRVLFHAGDKTLALADAKRNWLALRAAPQAVEAVNPVKTNEDSSEETLQLPPYPEELLNLPYNLGDIQAYVLNRMSYPSVATAGITAFAIVSALAQSHITVKSRDGLGLNEYYMILAPTGFGKEELRQPFVQLNKLAEKEARSRCERLKIHYSAPASVQGLHRMLEADRSLIMLADEYAEWLRQTGKQDQHKQAALGYSMQAYTKALSTLYPGATAKGDYKEVENPRLSIFATSTAEAMFETINKEHADAGAYNRFVMFMGEQHLPNKRYEGLIYEPEPSIIDFIVWLKEQSQSEIKFSKDGWKAFKKLDQAMAEPIKRKDGILGGRLAEQAIKMGGVIALSDRRFEITEDDIQTAFNIRIGLYKRAHFSVQMDGNLQGLHRTGEAKAQLVEVLRKNEVLYISQLDKRSRKYQKLGLLEQKLVVETIVREGFAMWAQESQIKLVSLIFQK